MASNPLISSVLLHSMTLCTESFKQTKPNSNKPKTSNIWRFFYLWVKKIGIMPQSIIIHGLAFIFDNFFAQFAISGFPKKKLVQYLFQPFFLLDTVLCKKTESDKNRVHTIGHRWLKRREALISYSYVILQ